MRNWREESGQVLVLTALSMSLMLGFMGFATDVGQLFHAKRSLQIGADDAAVAGALAYKYDAEKAKSASATTTDIQNAATAALTANGLSNVTISSTYSSNVTSSTLFISSPPVDGPNANSTGFVEAILTVPQNTMFMSIFGFHKVNVMTRAVAGIGSTSSGCVYVLNPTNASPAAYFGGNFDVQAPSCGVVVDGTGNCVMQFNGTSGQLNAASVSIQGGACGQSGDSNPAPTTGGYVADPLQQVISWPAASDCTVSPDAGAVAGTVTSITTTPTFATGAVVCFKNPVTISNSSSPSNCTLNTDGTPNLTSGPWLLLPSAMYVFGGGVTFNGGCIGSAAGGTTFDLTGSVKQGSTYYSMQVSTQTKFALYGMSTSMGTFGNQGVVIEQPPANTATLSINQGTSTGNITGTIYAPTGQLALIDQGGTASTGGTPALTLTVDLIVGTLSDTASNITITKASGAQTSNALTKVVLVE